MAKITKDTDVETTDTEEVSKSLSRRAITTHELTLNMVGNLQPIGSDEFGDSEVVFYDLSDGFITYAYGLDGKINIKKMIMRAAQNAGARLTPERQHEANVERTRSLIMDKLEGKPVKEDFTVDEY